MIKNTRKVKRKARKRLGIYTHSITTLSQDNLPRRTETRDSLAHGEVLVTRRDAAPNVAYFIKLAQEIPHLGALEVLESVLPTEC